MASLIVWDRIDNDPLSAVLARVTYRLMEREWKRLGPMGASPDTALDLLQDRLRVEGWPVLHGWLLAFRYYRHTKGCSARHWRDCTVRRGRLAAANRRAGRPWQRVPPCY